MMKTRLVGLLAVALGLLASGEASAGETRRTMNLEWFHMPRRDAKVLIYQQAELPNAKLTFMRWSDGDRAFLLEFEHGVQCSTFAKDGTPAHLTCGFRAAYYDLVQHPGKNAKLEWVVDEPSEPAADKQPAPTAPKAKVRL